MNANKISEESKIDENPVEILIRKTEGWRKIFESLIISTFIAEDLKLLHLEKTNKHYTIVVEFIQSWPRQWTVTWFNRQMFY